MMIVPLHTMIAFGTVDGTWGSEDPAFVTVLSIKVESGVGKQVTTVLLVKAGFRDLEVVAVGLSSGDLLGDYAGVGCYAFYHEQVSGDVGKDQETDQFIVLLDYHAN